MKICEISIMRGPNYWSGYRQELIVMKLDLEEMEEYPTNRIDGFYERLTTMLPSMYSHRCSEGHEGGFFERVKDGTWMGHVIEHIALELQMLAGMDCGFGRTRSAEKEGIYNVLFSYEFERAGLYAAKAAFRIAEALINNTPYPIEEDIEELKRIKQEEDYGPSTQSIVNEAKKRGIPYRRLNDASLLMFGQGVYQKKIRATMTEHTSGLGTDIAGDKEETKKMLAKACIPLPQSSTVIDREDLDEAISRLGFPLVIKPVDGNHGRGVTTNIRNNEQAYTAFQSAKAISRRVIVESFVQGYDYRMLVINYKLVAVALRTPAMIVGNGSSTIKQLIDETNTNPERGNGHEKTLTSIKIDEVTLGILAEKGMTLDTVLSFGELLTVKNTANISTGGTSTDVTERVHPANRLMAERIAKLLNLDICGIDVIAVDINKPVNKHTGAVIEVNACPGFRMHLAPSFGLARNVAAPVLDMLYPPGSKSRIPVIAITGTNGKTTTTRLIAHMMGHAGYHTGYTTTDGIYIQGHMIMEGDCTGPKSAEVVLTDPTVDMAVLECARGGIIRSGLGFDHCNIGIVTNISEDHLGLKDINTMEEMAKVKSVVPRSVVSDGYAILNADNDLVYNMKDDLDCKIALFSTDPKNERIKKHCQKGGLAAVLEEGFFVILDGSWKTRVELVENVPLCYGGKAGCMIKNVLPAILAARIQGLSSLQIKQSLLSFIPSPALTPGRLNLFKFKDFEVMVDYAHNTDGFIELKKFVDKIKAVSKTGIIAAVGDRRDEDIQNLGYYAAQMFDRIIIRHDKDPRGKTHEELEDLLIKGIRSADPDLPVTVIPDELDSIKYAMETIDKGGFIVVCTEEIQKTIAFLTAASEHVNYPGTNGRDIVDFRLLRAS